MRSLKLESKYSKLLTCQKVLIFRMQYRVFNSLELSIVQKSGLGTGTVEPMLVVSREKTWRSPAVSALLPSLPKDSQLLTSNQQTLLLLFCSAKWSEWSTKCPRKSFKYVSAWKVRRCVVRIYDINIHSLNSKKRWHQEENVFNTCHANLPEDSWWTPCLRYWDCV